jgi:cytochrome c oxidase subunit IV
VWSSIEFYFCKSFVASIWTDPYLLSALTHLRDSLGIQGVQYYVLLLGSKFRL